MHALLKVSHNKPICLLVHLGIPITWTQCWASDIWTQVIHPKSLGYKYTQAIHQGHKVTNHIGKFSPIAFGKSRFQ